MHITDKYALDGILAFGNGGDHKKILYIYF